MNAEVARYDAARRYVDVEVVRLTPRRKDPEGKVAAARAFNRALGDPQRCAPAVQVAGTSGKGSVCALIASALRAAGLRTGLHVSPYLQVFTEKTWIDGRYLSPAGFERALDQARPHVEAIRHDEDCPASVHGMASLGVSYLAFAEAKVEALVMETGVGGRYDLVQGLDRALTVITDLGLDHVKALGETLEEIAWHKAGVMERGVPCVAVRGAGWDVLAREAAAVGADLEPIDPDAVLVARDGRRITLRLPHLGALEVDLPGAAPFMARNAAVAGVALDRLARSGWAVTAEAVREGFAQRVLPGRFEVVQAAGPRVLLDGAHNPQKLQALLAGLDGPVTALVAASGQRTPEGQLSSLAPRVSDLFATELDLYGKAVLPAASLAEAARGLGVRAQAVTPPEEALAQALEAAGPEGTLLVTGSLYLLGRLRSHWHPWEQVLLQGTSWPARAPS